MTYARLILGAEARSAWNWVRRDRRGRRTAVAVVVAALVLAPTMGGVVAATGFLLGRLDIDPAGALAAAFTVITGVMFVFALPGVLAAFYTDRQLLLYAAAPVPANQLFLARLAQASVPALVCGAVPLALAAGYAAGRGAGAGWLGLTLLLVLTTAAAVVGFEVVLMGFVLRAVPAQRAREGAALLVALTAAAFYLAQFQLSGRARLLRGSPRQVLEQATAIGDRLLWLPTSWPAEALGSWTQRGPAAALPWIGLSLALTAVSLLAGWALYRETFVLGLGVFGEAGAARPGRHRPRTASAVPVATEPARPVRALAFKDVLAARRDLRRLAGVLPAIVLAASYTFANSQRVRGGGLWSVILPLGFIPFMTSLAVAVPAVAYEGRGMQLLALSGFPTRRLLAAKLLATVPIIAGLSEAAGIVIALARRAEPPDVLATIAVAAWLGAGGAAIGVAAGCFTPDFNAANPRRGGGVVGTLSGMGAMLVFAAVSYGAVAAWYFAPGAGRWTVWLAAVGAGGLAVAGGVAAAMLAAAAATLARYRPG